MARERRPSSRDSAVERERRERARRERERRRASTPERTSTRPARDARTRPPQAASDVAVRERHEGLVGWVVRNVVSLPTTIASIPGLLVAALRTFALEVVAVLGGIGRVLLSVVPGSSRVAGAGRTVVERSAVGRTRTRPPRTAAQQRASEQRRARTRSRVRGLLVVTLVVGGVAAWTVVPASDAFRIRHLEVTGAGAVSDLEVRERIDALLAGKTVFTVDEDKLAERISELPFVRSVRVERHLPGGLQLHIVEYRPLALGLGDGQFWLVAPDGRVLAKARPDDWSGRIPTVTLQDADIKPGDHVDDEPALRLLSSRPSSSTLEFEKIVTDDYVITAQLVGGIEVRFGRPVALRQKLLVAEAMLQQAARKDLTPRYVDVTVPGKPAFCATSVVACGMRRGPVTDDAKSPAAAGGDGAAADAAAGGGVTNGADELAAEDA